MEFVISMDKNQSTSFQTSFIPKKPLAEERVSAPRHTSIFSFFATLVFFASLASAAAIYFYQSNLLKTNAEKASEIAIARNSFEPSLIQTLSLLDRRITDAKQLLSGHIVVSPIFEALQVNTLKTIQFTKFSYITPTDPTAPIVVNMSGRAHDYSSIALQSDQLATNKDIHNSIFSNLALDPLTGNVTFDLTFTVDPQLVNFDSQIQNYLSATGTTTTTTTDASGATTTTGTTPDSTAAPGTNAQGAVTSASQ